MADGLLSLLGKSIGSDLNLAPGQTNQSGIPTGGLLSALENPSSLSLLGMLQGTGSKSTAPPASPPGFTAPALPIREPAGRMNVDAAKQLVQQLFQTTDPSQLESLIKSFQGYGMDLSPLLQSLQGASAGSTPGAPPPAAPG